MKHLYQEVLSEIYKMVKCMAEGFVQMIGKAFPIDILILYMIVIKYHFLYYSMKTCDPKSEAIFDIEVFEISHSLNDVKD